MCVFCCENGPRRLAKGVSLKCCPAGCLGSFFVVFQRSHMVEGKRTRCHGTQADHVPHVLMACEIGLEPVSRLDIAFVALS